MLVCVSGVYITHAGLFIFCSVFNLPVSFHMYIATNTLFILTSLSNIWNSLCPIECLFLNINLLNLTINSNIQKKKSPREGEGDDDIIDATQSNLFFLNTTTLLL